MKYLLIILLLCSCSAAKRCERHMKKAEQLGCLSVKSDTIIKYDTLRGFRIDTVIQFHQDIDTLIIDSAGVKSITIIKWKDKIVSQTITKKDIIIKTLSVSKVILKEYQAKGKLTWWEWLIYIAMGLAILKLIFRK